MIKWLTKNNKITWQLKEKTIEKDQYYIYDNDESRKYLYVIKK